MDSKAPFARLAASTAICAGAALAAPLARADGPTSSDAFGAQGQWVIVGSSTTVNVSSEKFSANSASLLDANAAVGVDRFVVRQLSLGIQLEGAYSNTKDYGVTSLYKTTSMHLAAGVRVGFNVPFGGWWSWYPRLTVGIDSNHSEGQTVSVFAPGASAAPPFTASRVGPFIALYAPVLLHPAEHFFVGFGPRLEYVFAEIHGGPYDSSLPTSLGAEFTVGGWWGDPRPREARIERAPVPLFGSEGQTVLTTDVTASLNALVYSGSDASTIRVGTSPGFDYFVMDRVSLGGGISFDYASETTFDSSRNKTDTVVESFGVAPRVGVDLPIGPGPFSLWPRAELGFGFSDVSQTSRARSTDETRHRYWVKVSAPFLFRATSHLLAGVGPYLVQDLTNADQNQVENDATKVGVQFLLGGWF
jgi:hypothetical protein